MPAWSEVELKQQKGLGPRARSALVRHGSDVERFFGPPGDTLDESGWCFRDGVQSHATEHQNIYEIYY